MFLEIDVHLRLGAKRRWPPRIVSFDVENENDDVVGDESGYSVMVRVAHYRDIGIGYLQGCVVIDDLRNVLT
jgi:hypothetical protein